MYSVILSCNSYVLDIHKSNFDWRVTQSIKECNIKSILQEKTNSIRSIQFDFLNELCINSHWMLILIGMKYVFWQTYVYCTLLHEFKKGFSYFLKTLGYQLEDSLTLWKLFVKGSSSFCSTCLPVLTWDHDNYHLLTCQT